MKLYTVIVIVGLCIVEMPNASAQTDKEKEKRTLEVQDKVERRKRCEQAQAQRWVAHAKKVTARSRLERKRKAQEAVDKKQDALDREYLALEQKHHKQAYRDEIRHFNALIEDLSAPTYKTARPISDLLHEAEFSLQTIASYNPRELNRYQARFESALRKGKLFDTRETKRNAQVDLIAQESLQSLIAYAHDAENMLERVALQTQEIKNEMNRTLAEQRATLAALNQERQEQLNASHARVETFPASLAKFNETLSQGEQKTNQKDAEAANLAQCVDTFNTVSNKFNRNRLDETEKIIQNLEAHAHKAEQHTALLKLRLQAAEKSLRAVEKNIQQLQTMPGGIAR